MPTHTGNALTFLKTSFLDTKDLSGDWKKIPDEKYYFIIEKKILQVENVSQKRDILRNLCCKWEGFHAIFAQNLWSKK